MITLSALVSMNKQVGGTGKIVNQHELELSIHKANYQAASIYKKLFYIGRALLRDRAFLEKNSETLDYFTEIMTGDEYDPQETLSKLITGAGTDN